MSKALFVCYGGGHADALIPVMTYLRKNTNVEVEAIGVNLAADKLRKSGIPCKTLSSYLDVRSVEVGFPLARDRHNFSSTVSFADSIAYYGYTMSDLIDEVGEGVAYQIQEIFDRRTMFPVKTMIRILQQEAPDVVVTTTMNRFEAATLYAAGLLGIGSVKVEDLIGRINKTFPDKIQVENEKEKEELIANGISPQNIIIKSELKNPIVMSYYEEIHQRQLDTRPTAFAVLCDYAKKEIEKRGIDPNSIHVTGQPAFDQHPWFLMHTKRSDVCSRIGIDEHKKLVTFMSQPNAEREDAFRTIIRALNSIDCSDINFIVKLHPNEDGRIQELILHEYGFDRIKLVKNFDARELLAVSDLIMTVSSTTGLEAAVMGKLLVYVNVTDKEDFIPFDDMRIGIKCTNDSELADVLKDALINGKSLSLPETSSYKTDGKASERVGELVKTIAEKQYKPTKRVVTIIQARMGSTRLPGKVLKDICGKAQVQHVIDSVSKSRFSSQIVVATSVDENNKPLKEYLTSHGICWFEGDEADVLERFIGAGEKYNADIVVRVTADNPLCNAECIDRMIESHIQRQADYTMMKGLPIGVAGEVVNYNVLKSVHESPDVTARDKEHVTIHVYEHPDRYKINYIQPPVKYNYPDIYLTVDTPEDFQRMTDIFEHCYHGESIELEEVIRYINGR